MKAAMEDRTPSSSGETEEKGRKKRKRKRRHLNEAWIYHKVSLIMEVFKS